MVEEKTIRNEFIDEEVTLDSGMHLSIYTWFDYHVESEPDGSEYRVMDGAELEVYSNYESAKMVCDLHNAGLDLDKLREIVNRENFKYLGVLLD